MMPFRYLDFVITGTPRSGTTYVASLLQELGVDCTHERCFDPWQVIFAEERPNTDPWGDSSWLAVPHLDDLPRSTSVVHVVRDPLKAINSIIGTGQLDWPHDYREFIAHHWRGDRDWWPNHLGNAGQGFWRDWNTRIEASGRVALRVQVESLANDFTTLVDVVDPKHVVSSLTTKPTEGRLSDRTNARPHYPPCPMLTRDSIDRETRELARRYGYDY